VIDIGLDEGLDVGLDVDSSGLKAITMSAHSILVDQSVVSFAN
jgi:hypothetical protein